MVLFFHTWSSHIVKEHFEERADYSLNVTVVYAANATTCTLALHRDTPSYPTYIREFDFHLCFFPFLNQTCLALEECFFWTLDFLLKPTINWRCTTRTVNQSRPRCDFIAAIGFDIESGAVPFASSMTIVRFWLGLKIFWFIAVVQIPLMSTVSTEMFCAKSRWGLIYGTIFLSKAQYWVLHCIFCSVTMVKSLVSGSRDLGYARLPVALFRTGGFCDHPYFTVITPWDNDFEQIWP